MKFNSTTLIIIALLLIILYLFDNIKSLEESIISNPSVKINYSPRRKYFQDIYFESKKKEKKEEEDKEEKFIGVPVKDIQVLPAVLPTHMPSQSFIKTEKQIVIPSQDKFISGASAPGSTTMVLGSPDKKEKPLFVDNLDRRFNFEFSNIL